MGSRFYFSSENEARFKCLCGFLHVRTATFILAFLQIICLCYSAVTVPLAYVHISPESWNLLTASFFIVAFTSGIIASVTLLGLVGEHPKLLFPQILWLIICGFLSCFLATLSAIAVSEGGWLAHELFRSEKWVINWNGVNKSLKIIICVLLVLVLNILIIIFSVWLVKVVVQCYRYIRAKVEFENRLATELGKEEQVPIAPEPHY